MTGLFGKKTTSSESPAYTGLELQQSALGVGIPVLIGQDRVAPFLMWYGDFKAKKGKQGGKGGAVGGGGKGGVTVYSYSASMAMGLCEGQVASVGSVWRGKSKTSLSALAMTLLNGAQTAAWSYLTSKHPSDAFVYPFTAYIGVSNLQLGNTPAIGNFTFETRSSEAGAYGSETDVDVARICEIVLTHPRLGVNFPFGGDFTEARNYCRALGLIGSLYVREQGPARDALTQLARSANLEWLWSGGALRPVPLGDADASGNGYSWTAPVTPAFDLGESDFLGRVEPERTRASDVRNSIKVEWKDRANEYNVATTEWKDEASISQIGLKAAPALQAHHFKKPAPAVLAAQFEGGRYAKRNSYRVPLDARYSALEPLDLLTITETVGELDHVPVRVERVTISPDGAVTVQCKERLSGLGNAAAYTFDGGTRPAEDYNETAPNVATPIIFEPPSALTDGRREVWIAVTGLGNWGGCEVWVSDDGTTYRQIDTIFGGARYGTLSTSLPSAASPDTTNTPRVNLTATEGELVSGTTADATALNTLALVDSELIAYRDATLVSANVYDLGYLIRGARGSAIAAHSVGATFVRLDENIAVFEFDDTRIGDTVYFKFVSFNRTEGGHQDIAAVSAYSKVLTGASYIEITPKPNRLKNSSGRFGLAHWTNPVPSTVGPFGSAYIPNGGFSTGAVSAYTNFQSQYVPVLAGQSYSASGKVWLGGRTAGAAHIYMAWVDSGGTEIGYPAETGPLTTNGNPHVWSAPNLVAPAGVVLLRMVLYCDALSASYCVFSELKIEDGIYATAWTEDADVVAASTDQIIDQSSVIGRAGLVTSLGTAAAITGQKSGATTQITAGTSAPGSPASGDWWLDTNTTVPIWKRWSGSAWVATNPEAPYLTAGGQIVDYRGLPINSLGPYGITRSVQNVIGATIPTTQITIISHTVYAPGGNISVTGGTITGLTASTIYDCFWRISNSTLSAEVAGSTAANEKRAHPDYLWLATGEPGAAANEEQGIDRLSYGNYL